MLALQLARTVRRSTPSPRFVSSSPPRAMLLFCCFERFGTVDFLVIFSFITPSFPCFIYFSVFPQFCYGYSSYVNSCLTVNFQMSSSHTLHFAYIIKTYNPPPPKIWKTPFSVTFGNSLINFFPLWDESDSKLLLDGIWYERYRWRQSTRRRSLRVALSPSIPNLPIFKKQLLVFLESHFGVNIHKLSTSKYVFLSQLWIKSA